MMSHKEFMQEAIKLSLDSVQNGGGPFGAVIVKDGQIISAKSNSVTLQNDPTAHAEINAIREACRKLQTFDLNGCTIYTSCEPCPMCLGAIYWANISEIYFANTKTDAKNINFDDSFIYDEIDKTYSERKIPTTQMMREEAIKAFKAWEQKEDKIEY